jgi:hypothetical protein
MTDLAVRTPNETADRELVRLETEQIQYLANTQFVNKYVRGNLPAVFATIATGREMGIGDMAALKHVYLIDGRPGCSAEIMAALVHRAGHLLEGEIGEGQATARGRRKDTGAELTVTWTMAMAKRAKLDQKDNWLKYPEAMLWARAVSQLCRALFSDCTAGFSYTPDELGVEHTDSVGEPEAAEVRGGNPVAVSQPDLDGVEAASPTDTETEGGGGSPSVDLGDPDIPFGDAPPDPPKPTKPMYDKLDVMVKAVGPNSLNEKVPNLLSRVYATVADIRGWTSDELVATIGGWDKDKGRLSWKILRAALSKHEAHELIDRLERLEAA